MPKFKSIKSEDQYKLAKQVLTELYMENVRTKEIIKQIADVTEVMERYEKKVAKKKP